MRDTTSSLQSPTLTIGVDVGGTFTDLVASDGDSLHVVKIPSTPPEFHRAVIDAVGRAGAFGMPRRIIHGSTVATNALLQRAGAPVAFVTTDGFRDMLLIGRQNRPSLYALHVQRPNPLTPEENWFTVRERISADGQVLEPIDEAEIDRLVGKIRSRGLWHVAVCLLFSFINPAHEQAIARRCRAAGLTVSLSSEVLPEFREYERASTTVVNAAMRPVVREYLSALEAGLFAAGGAGASPSAMANSAAGVADPDFPGPPGVSAGPGSATPVAVEKGGCSLAIMHSSGGTLTVRQAADQAARLVLSGPAGGVIGAAFVAEQAGFAQAITYDMGGTSTDVAVILDGQPQWTTSTTIDGLPIGLPMFDIHTVGAGGGSVAYLDAGGALRVGPRSAGAKPGPACYARGGVEPTVTDANLVLGRIAPDHFLGGKMRIDPALARAAVGGLAEAMGKSLTETAIGIIRVADANMEHAIRNVTSRRGYDPRQFVLVSFGGAGGLHACALAEALDIRRVLIPPYCGVLSALGMIVAAPIADASRTVVHLGDALDDARLAAELSALADATAATIPPAATDRTEAFADIRFRGQSHELTVPLSQPTRGQAGERFLDAYRQRYGRVPENRPIEIVTLRLRRFGRSARPQLPKVLPSPRGPARQAELAGADGSMQQAQAVSRSDLAPSASSPGQPGPILLIDPEATTFIPAGWCASASENGSVLLEMS